MGGSSSSFPDSSCLSSFRSKPLNSPIVVLTAPHSKCNEDSPFRMCDTNASQAKDSLAKAIRNKGLEVTEFQADIFRKDADLNRIGSRYLPFRNAVRSFLQSNKDSILYLLDIHSFPYGYTGFGESTKLCILDDSSFLNNDLPSSSFCDESKLLQSMLINAGIPSVILNGSVNDIQNEARSQLGIPCLLLEYREDLTKIQLDDINTVISSWIIKINASLSSQS